MRTKLLALALVAAASAALAQPAALKPPLAGLGFLVGDWTSGEGKVADTGGTSIGTSKITVEADGSALLRHDRNSLFDAHGKPAGGFSQIMLIYPEGGTVHADYSDGEGHVIHYTSAAVTPGHAVVFTSPATGAPGFRLAYTLTAKGDLDVDFGMLPPGGGALRPIANGTLHKGR